MSFTKLGFHVTTGSRNGYGPAAKAGPAVARLVDEFGAADEIPDGTVVLLRTTRFYLEAPEELNSATLGEALALGRSYAGKIWEVLSPIYDRHGDRLRLYIQVLNEFGGGYNVEQIRRSVEFERGAASYLNGLGYKVAHFSHAADSPVIEIWKTEIFPFLVETSKKGNIYARHVYGGVHPQSSDYLTDGVDTIVDPTALRLLDEINHFKAKGQFIPFVVAECGQKGGDIYPNLNDYAVFDKWTQQFDMIWGFCTWTWGHWRNGWGNLEQVAGDLTEYLQGKTRALYAERPAGPPVNEGNDEARVPYARRFVLLPQEMALEEALPIIKAEWDLRPTFGKSADDAGIGDGLKSKTVVVYNADTWGGEDALQVFYEDHYPGVTDIQFLYTEKKDPMEGVRLGPLLDQKYTYTSLFGAPRVYNGKQAKHEGLDADSFEVGESVANVLATYPGFVSSIQDSATGYGLAVRLQHKTPEGYIFFTRYAHLDRVFVSAGQQIVMGSKLGEIGDTGNSFGEHVHFNLETPGTGLSGYVVADVRDPEPFLPDPESLYNNLRPAAIGLHASAQPGDLSDREVAMFRQIRPEIIKVLSAHSETSIERLAAEHSAAIFVVRAFLHMEGRQISPSQFVNDTIGDTKRAVNALTKHGVPLSRIYIELHNEPNLTLEGLGSSWRSGSDFGIWYLAVLQEYRSELRGVRYMFPGLSPGWTVSGVRQDHRSFLSQCASVIAVSDAVGVHSYWSDTFPYGSDPNSGIAILREYAAAYGQKPLIVTEASNNGPAPGSRKGLEYLTFRNDCTRFGYLGVAFYVASAYPGTFDNEVWIDQDGNSTGIAEVIASR